MIGVVVVLAVALVGALWGWARTWSQLERERSRRQGLAAELVGAYLSLEAERIGRCRT